MLRRARAGGAANCEEPGGGAAAAPIKGRKAGRMTDKIIELVITGTFAALLFAALHAIPWGRMAKRQIGPPWSYIAGTTGLGIVFSALMWRWGDGWAIAGFWTVVVCAGGSVFVGYDIRLRLEKQARESDLNKSFALTSELIRNWRKGEPDGEGEAGAGR